MKKYFGFTALALIITITCASMVYAYFDGPTGEEFELTARGGVELKGIWMEGTMTNANANAYNYEKRIYVHQGGSGSYSSWVSRNEYKVTHRDYGSFTNDTAYINGEWRLPS